MVAARRSTLVLEHLRRLLVRLTGEEESSGPRFELLCCVGPAGGRQRGLAGWRE